MARVSADVNPGSMDVSVGGRGSVLATPKAKWATAHRVTEWENSSGVGWRAASREALNALGGPLICKFKKEDTVGAGCVRCYWSGRATTGFRLFNGILEFGSPQTPNFQTSHPLSYPPRSNKPVKDVVRRPSHTTFSGGDIFAMNTFLYRPQLTPSLIDEAWFPRYDIDEEAMLEAEEADLKYAMKRIRKAKAVPVVGIRKDGEGEEVETEGGGDSDSTNSEVDTSMASAASDDDTDL